MDATPLDPVTLVDGLDPDAIRKQLDDLDRQSSALRVLLRAAIARKRAAQRQQSGDAQREGGRRRAE
jgi:hypothetical protein